MSGIKLRGSVQVFTEISSQLAAFGDTHFSADRSMLVYWAGLLAEELASEIAAGVPEVKRAVEAYEQAKKIPASLLRQTVAAPAPVATPPTATPDTGEAPSDRLHEAVGDGAAIRKDAGPHTSSLAKAADASVSAYRAPAPQQSRPKYPGVHPATANVIARLEWASRMMVRQPAHRRHRNAARLELVAILSKLQTAATTTPPPTATPNEGFTNAYVARDRQRLLWMVQNAAFVREHTGRLPRYGVYSDNATLEVLGEAQTYRAAIDAAMERE